jgi:hypothetical protein
MTTNDPDMARATLAYLISCKIADLQLLSSNHLEACAISFVSDYFANEDFFVSRHFY